jgi:hypothetical protein
MGGEREGDFTDNFNMGHKYSVNTVGQGGMEMLCCDSMTLLC